MRSFMISLLRKKNVCLRRAKEVIADYRLCKALAACYELQDHLADIIAGMVERGETEDF